MAGTFKLATAFAALAAVGWVVTGGPGPRPGPSQAGAPSPSPASVVGDEWAFFSGRVQNVGQSVTGPSDEYTDNGLWVSVGYGFHDQTMVSDDPRMTGTRTDALNLFSEAPNNSQKNFGSELVTITNDEGAWTCPMTMIHVVTETEPGGEFAQLSGWCAGSGAYDGLKAYLTFHSARDGSPGEDVAYGFITSGDGPPMPEAPAS